MRSLRALLKRLVAWFAGSSGEGPSGDGDLPLTRLAFSKRWLITTGDGLRFRPIAFMPYLPARQDPELSVFRIGDLTDREVWGHVRKHARRPGSNLHGRADFQLAELDAGVLKLVLDDTPPRHGNVVGWPEDKDGQLALAQDLAAVARASRPPDTGAAA